MRTTEQFVQSLCWQQGAEQPALPGHCTDPECIRMPPALSLQVRGIENRTSVIHKLRRSHLETKLASVNNYGNGVIGSLSIILPMFKYL